MGQNRRPENISLGRVYWVFSARNRASSLPKGVEVRDVVYREPGNVLGDQRNKWFDFLA